MPSWDAVQPRHVRQAAAEYDELNQEELLTRYGFGRARTFLLIIDGKAYDSKAVLGVAYKHATGQLLGPHEFSGGVKGAARVLRALGFEVRNLRDPAKLSTVEGQWRSWRLVDVLEEDPTIEAAALGPLAPRLKLNVLPFHVVSLG